MVLCDFCTFAHPAIAPCSNRWSHNTTDSNRPLCDIEWSELHARKLSSGDVNSVQHRVIAVAVDARGRDQRQALGRFQGHMPQLGAPIKLRLVEAIDERIVGHLFEALQGKVRPRAIAQQPFQAGAVGAFDADRSIQRKRSDSAVSVQANAGLAGVKRSGRS
jgi:hypothetical protein